MFNFWMFLLFATARSPFWMPRHGLVFGRSKYSTSVFKSSGLSSSWYAHCLWRMCEWCKGMDWCNQLFFDPVNVALTLSLKFHDTVKIIDHRILKKKLKWRRYLSNDPMLSVCRKFVTRQLIMSFWPIAQWWSTWSTNQKVLGLATIGSTGVLFLQVLPV